MSATDRSADGGAAAAGITRLPTAGPGARASAGRSERATADLARLAEVVLPADDRAPGATRIVIEHCVTGLVARSILEQAKLLGTELVTNCLEHAGLRAHDPLLIRVALGAEALRIEVENPGTVGIVRARAPDRRSGGGFGLRLVDSLAVRWGVRRTHSTTVWFESTRA